MKLLLRFLLIFIYAKLINCKPQNLQEQTAQQYSLDPLNEAQQEALLKDPGKRTIGLSPRYAIGKHVGINSHGYKYLLGYSPINFKYVPLIRPVTLLKPVLHGHKWKPMVLKPVHAGDHGSGWKPLVVHNEKPVVEPEQPVALRPAIPFQPTLPLQPGLPLQPTLHNYFYFQTPISRPALLPHPLFHLRKPNLPVLPLGAVFPSQLLQAPFGLQGMHLPNFAQIYPGLGQASPGFQIHPQLVPNLQFPVHPFLHPGFAVQHNPEHQRPGVLIPQGHPGVVFQQPQPHDVGVHHEHPQQPHEVAVHHGHPQQPHDVGVHHGHPQSPHDVAVHHGHSQSPHDVGVHYGHPQPGPDFHIQHAHPGIVQPAQPDAHQPYPDFQNQPQPDNYPHVQPYPEFNYPSQAQPENHPHQSHPQSYPEYTFHNHAQPSPPDNPPHHAHIFQQQPQQHPASVEYHGIPNFFANNLLFHQQRFGAQQESFNPESSIQPGHSDLQLPLHLPDHPHFRQIYNVNSFQPITNPDHQLSNNAALRPGVSLETPITHEHGN